MTNKSHCDSQKFTSTRRSATYSVAYVAYEPSHCWSTCTTRMRDVFHSFKMSISQHNEHFCFIEPVAMRSMTELTGIQNSIITSTNGTSFHLTKMTAFDGTLISCCYNIPDLPLSPSLSLSVSKVQSIEMWKSTAQVRNISFTSKELRETLAMSIK